MSTYQNDYILIRELESLSRIDKEYWSFRGKATRENTHAYFQYPAMMVPQMQNILIENILKVEPDIKNVLDPFVGSGTVMTEVMFKGLNFTGQDINPLSILLCQAKKGPFDFNTLKDKINNLLNNIAKDNNLKIEIDFNSISKWFKQEVSIELSKIRQAIKVEELLWVRRFFWVALAETIRLTSNSRTSTFKLHIRPTEEIKKRNLSPIKVFTEVLGRNLSKYANQKSILEERNLLKNGSYIGNISIELGNSSKKIPLNSLEKYDLLVTSPPYGDNKTTVPYGQCAYLPLHWIELKDIDPELDNSWLLSTWEIDSRSLGGKTGGALIKAEKLFDISTSFKSIIKKLKNESSDRINKVAAFCYDLDCCIDPILSVLKPNACMIWIIGNRHVAQYKIPLDNIMADLITARGGKIVTKLKRKIPTKRMAVRNNIANTMGTETILIMRKGEADA
jgi:DNA modification methylase